MKPFLCAMLTTFTAQTCNCMVYAGGFYTYKEPDFFLLSVWFQKKNYTLSRKKFLPLVFSHSTCTYEKVCMKCGISIFAFRLEICQYLFYHRFLCIFEPSYVKRDYLKCLRPLQMHTQECSVYPVLTGGWLWVSSPV